MNSSQGRNNQNPTVVPTNLLEICKVSASEILCFFPNGELKHGEWVDKSAQKGPTSWFYAAKNLAWNNLEPSPEQAIILDYIKATAQAHIHHLVARELKRRLSIKPTPAEIINAISHAKTAFNFSLKFYSNLEDECKNIDWEAVTTLVEKYLAMPDQDIEQTDIDALAINTIKQLESCSAFKANEGFFSRMLRQGAEKLKKNNLLIEEGGALLVSQYHSLISKRLYASFGIVKIEKTKWEDACDLQNALFVYLEQAGPVLAVGKFGVPYHEQEDQPLGNELGTRTLYGWDKPDRIAAHDTHAINVIGLKTNNKHPEKSLVVFIDPSDSSKVHGERRAYTITMQDFLMNLEQLYQCENYYVPLALFQQQAPEIWIPAGISPGQYVHSCVQDRIALLKTEILNKKTWKTIGGERAEPARHAQNILDIIAALGNTVRVDDWIQADKEISAILNSMQHKTWNRSDDTQDFYEHLKKCYEREFLQQAQDVSVKLPYYVEDRLLQKRLSEMREIYRTESGWKTHMSALQKLIYDVKSSSKVQARTEEFSETRFRNHVAMLEQELEREFTALCRPLDGYFGLFARQARSVQDVLAYLNIDMHNAQTSGGRMHDNYVRLLAATLQEIYGVHGKSFGKNYFAQKHYVKGIVDGIQVPSRYQFEGVDRIRARI
jgi:hypothetical protein